jgi:VWFA-related protein
MHIRRNSHLRWLTLASLLLTTAFTPPRQEALGIQITQVDTSAFPRITVYVSLTDEAGEPVSVDPSQIRLSEGGETMTPSEIRALGEGESLATLLVIDVSGSMNKADKLDSAKEAAKAYVRQMRANDVAGLLSFNTARQLVQPLTDDRAALIDAIDGLKADGDTAMYDALYEGVGILSARTGRNAIIVLTDGLDNRSQHTLNEVTSLIGPGGLSISTVGLGDPSQLGLNMAGLDVPGLRALAARAGGSYASAADRASLMSVYERYGRALHSEYALTYVTSLPLRDGVNRSLSVALASPGLTASASAKYNPGGLVPEVAGANSWSLFFVLFGGLVVLLLAPGLIGRGIQAVRGSPTPEPRIRLADPPKPRVRVR